MSKHYIGRHKAWGLEDNGPSAEHIARNMGCEVADLEVTEMEKTDFILQSVPVEFRGPLSFMAYERGHSAGEAEVESILEGLVYDLAPAIKAYTIRLTNR